jgi:hypothetical protein
MEGDARWRNSPALSNVKWHVMYPNSSVAPDYDVGDAVPKLGVVVHEGGYRSSGAEEVARHR